jgi:hypothetical protein
MTGDCNHEESAGDFPERRGPIRFGNLIGHVASSPVRIEAYQQIVAVCGNFMHHVRVKRKKRHLEGLFPRSIAGTLLALGVRYPYLFT